MSKRGASGINLLLGIDKPLGCTSHDVVNRVRRILGETRVGHAGTLDPLASGVMVVGVGQATRLLGLVANDTKRYLARFSFGRETLTDDEEGETRRSAPAPARALDPSFARDSMEILRKMTLQVPPAYSAVSVDGKRSYAAARAGQELELAPRRIEVYEALVEGIGTDGSGEPYWDVSLAVSKGTYVRSLARDLGRSLGSACHVAALRRTSSGTVDISMCLTLEGLADLHGRGEKLPALDPVAVLNVPFVDLDDCEARRVRDGKPLSILTGRVRGESRQSDQNERDEIVALVYHGQVRAVARKELRAGADGAAPSGAKESKLSDACLLKMQAVFPDGIDGVVLHEGW